MSKTALGFPACYKPRPSQPPSSHRQPRSSSAASPAPHEPRVGVGVGGGGGPDAVLDGPFAL